MNASLDALPTEARLTAHLACQLASAPGTSLATPREDFSHTALTWDPELKALTGVAVTSTSRRTALVPETLELQILDGGTRNAPKLLLAGRTMDEGLAWLSRELGAPLKPPAHDLPDHPTLHGKPFGEGIAGLAHVTRWLSFGQESLARVAPTGASPLTLWPHHFDLASLLSVGRNDQGEEQTVGLGLSLGDGTYEQPYFYVSPWPYPDPARLARLERGLWHTDGFTAAILNGPELTHGPFESAASGAVAFLREATAAARASLQPATT